MAPRKEKEKEGKPAEPDGQLMEGCKAAYLIDKLALIRQVI